MEIILFLIISITYIFWAIVGLIIWIPLLFRTIAIYSFSIAFSAISNPPVQYMKKNERNTKKAVGFYYNGFITINHLWRNRNKEDSEELEDIKRDEKKFETDFNIHWSRFAMEILWTTIFWVPVIILLLS